MILHQHAIQKDSDIGWRFPGTLRVEGWGGPHHVVGLPLPGLVHRVCQRNALLVDAAGLAVNVGFVVVRVEDLQLISGIAWTRGGEKHPTVATRLTGAGDVLRNFPFNAELIVPEAPLGFNITGSLIHGEYTVRNDPFGRRLVLDRYPLV